MLFFKDAYSQTQFKKWYKKALDAQRAKEASLKGTISLLVIGDKDRARDCRNDGELHEWSDRFIDQINVWMSLSLDSHDLIHLYASKHDEVDGLVNEFGVCVYRRESDDYEWFTNTIDILNHSSGRTPPFVYNGGFINHGSNEQPSWSMHT